MGQCDHRAERKLNLETEGNIEHHQAQSSEHGDPAIVSQLFTHLGSDKLDPAQLDAHVGGRPKLIDHQCTLLIRVAVRQAHQHILVSTKADHHGALVALLIQHRANRTQIGAVAVGHFDQSAAREIKAPVKLPDRERTDGSQHCGRGQCHGHPAPLHERYGFHAGAPSVLDRLLPMPPIASDFTRRPP